MSAVPILVGCGVAKLPHAAPASELYTGSLARAAIGFAQASGRPWGIISARYGLLKPNKVIEPYDQRIPPRRDLAGRLRFAQQLYVQLREQGWAGELELHMGRDYVETVAHVCATGTYSIVTPLRGLTQGERLAWYRRQRQPDAERLQMRRRLRDLTTDEADGLYLARTLLDQHGLDGLDLESVDPWQRAIVRGRSTAMDAFRCLVTELLTWGVGAPR